MLHKYDIHWKMNKMSYYIKLDIILPSLFIEQKVACQEYFLMC